MNAEKIIFRNAMKIFVGVVLFFFLMKLIKVDHITELRALNFLFVFWGINSAIKTNIFKNHNNTYFSNLFIGFSTSFLSVILISIALMIYLFYIDPNFVRTIENLFLWGSELTPPLITFAILIEGIASSIICTFIVMQYWKKYKINGSAAA